MGQPLRMAEMIAGLDGPVYVERVALFDAKQRVRAQKAIQKALKLQVDQKGFAFVEVLAECPLHLKMTPGRGGAVGEGAARSRVPAGGQEGHPRTRLVGRPAASAFRSRRAARGGGRRPGAAHRASPRAFRGRSSASDIALKLAGAGGDGAQTAALLLTRAAINEGWDATHIPSYGPESRGGTSYADVHIAEQEVLQAAAPHPHLLIAFNQPSLGQVRAPGRAGRHGDLRQLGGGRAARPRRPG